MNGTDPTVSGVLPCGCEACTIKSHDLDRRMHQLESAWAYHLHKWCEHIVWIDEVGKDSSNCIRGNWHLIESPFANPFQIVVRPLWMFCPRCGSKRP